MQCDKTNLTITSSRTYKTLKNAKRAIENTFSKVIAYSIDDDITPIAFHISEYMQYNGRFCDMGEFEKQKVMGIIIREHDKFIVRYVNSRW